MKTTCAIPFCKRKVEAAVEGICDRHWLLAPETLRDAYLRCEGDDAEIYRHWARVRRAISQKVTTPK